MARRARQRERGAVTVENKTIHRVLFLAFLILSVCGSAFAAEKRTVKDHLGIDVELPAKIERVAIVSPLPLPTVLAVYQGGDVSNLVAMPPDLLNTAKHSILGRYTPGILNVSTDFYKGGELNIEELMKLKPDVVFYTGAAGTEIYRKAGLPAVAFAHPQIGTDPSTLNTLEMWLTLMEEVLQKKSAAIGIVEYGRSVEAEIAKRVKNIPGEKRKKALIVNNYTDSALTAGGRRTFGTYWCDATGSVNVALKAEKNLINMEQVYEWAPDTIFLTTFTAVMPDDLYNNTAAPGHDWSSVPAVMERACYKFPLGMHRWWPPSTDTPLALLWVAKNTYPELFENINIPEETKAYYKRFYGMELSDEDVYGILNPDPAMRRKFF